MPKPTDNTPERSEQPAVEIVDGGASALADAMDTIVAYLPHIQKVALSLAPPGDPPEDFVHDVVLYLLHVLGAFRHDCPIKTYITSMIAYAAREKKRTWSRRNDLLTPVKPDLASQRNGPSVESLYSQQEVIRLVHEAIRELGDSDQELILLHHISGVSISELAEILVASTGAIKMRLSRARDLLRVALEKKISSGATSARP